MSEKKKITPRFPTIKVDLAGTEGSSFAVLARCKQAMKNAGAAPKMQRQFIREATRSDYDRLLRIAMVWFDVE